MSTKVISKDKFEEAVIYQNTNDSTDEEVSCEILGKEEILVYVYKMYKSYSEMSKGFIESMKVAAKYIEINHNEGGLLWSTRIDIDAKE